MAVAAMAVAVPGSAVVNGNGKLEEPDHSSNNWYFSREHIEKRSPSRQDGIDLKKETYFRKSYCVFLQDLGMCLKVPQVTIATAIVFSHRFFLRQSHFKNDRHIIATICMFLAGKVEETPRPLRDVILVSYEIRHKKDPSAVARIKQKETYEEQKEQVLIGERLVLTTLAFDLNIAHPYKPLVAAIKKLQVAQNALAQVAWNFVNDGLRTSLCLQFKPHHIAAGAIFLAAKFLKVKLPQDGDKVWWQEFEVTPRQLEEVSNQMLELYEQNKTLGTLCVPNGSRGSDGGSLTVNRGKGSDQLPSANGHHWIHTASNGDCVDKTDKLAQAAGKPEDAIASGKRDDVHEVTVSSTPSFSQGKQENSRLGTESQPVYDNGNAPGAPDAALGSKRAVKSVSTAQLKQVIKEEVKEQIADGQIKELFRADFRVKSESVTTVRKAKVKTEMEDRKVTIVDDVFAREVTEAQSSLEDRDTEDVVDSKPGLEVTMDSAKVKVENEDEELKKSQLTSMEGVNLDRVNILKEEKRRKSKGEGLEFKATSVKMDLNDEEELLQRDRESGVEAGPEVERLKQERRDFKLKSAQKSEHPIAGGKREGTENVEGGLKRRRNNEEDGANDRKWSKSSDRGDRADGQDGEADKSRVGPSDRGEDGELPTSNHAHDHTRSPRQGDRRPGSHEKVSSPSSLKRHRDQHGRRDSHRDNRAGYGPRERDYHQRDNHHRTDGDRDRHHYKERDYQERDHKRGRVHEPHGS